MFGCLGRIGCLILLVVLAVGGWYTQSWWYPRVRAMVVATPPAATVAWSPISADQATTASRAVSRLGERSGPAYASLTPAQFAALQLEPAMKILGSSAGNPEASISGDTLLLRANVAVTELGDPKSLGPLAGMLDGRQPVLIGGRLSMVQPGVIGLHVTQMTVKELRLPGGLIDRIVRRISVRQRTDSLAPGVIAMPAPAGVADVRVANGKVVLYKAVP
ncbi:MAG: hypothetical protein HYV19_02385 [Gemmatimonadetes bacterium]|nr:hypothetical protein [Gemmatimonadota bacterium]